MIMSMSMYVFCIVSICCSPCGPPSHPPNDAASAQFYNFGGLGAKMLRICSFWALPVESVKSLRMPWFRRAGMETQQNAGFGNTL